MPLESDLPDLIERGKGSNALRSLIYMSDSSIALFLQKHCLISYTANL